MINFRKKSEIFCFLFSKQYPLIHSDLSLLFKKNRKTGNSLSSVGLSTEDMLNVINNLDFDRTHAHDEISIGC